MSDIAIIAIVVTICALAVSGAGYVLMQRPQSVVDKALKNEVRVERAPADLRAGIIAGLIATLLGTLGWIAINITLTSSIVSLSLVLAAVIGTTIRFFGRGKSIGFQWLAGSYALLGCFLVDTFMFARYSSLLTGNSMWTVLANHPLLDLIYYFVFAQGILTIPLYLVSFWLAFNLAVPRDDGQDWLERLAKSLRKS